jgi:hypothetical protein
MILFSRSRGRLIAAALLVMVWAIPSWAGDETLDELIEQVGSTYAEGYLAPLVHGFGINVNTGLYHTAKIPNTRLKFSVGFKTMATKINDADKSFRIVQPVTLDENLGFEPGDDGYGEEGQLVFEGPTVFGDEDEKGTVTAYYHGVPAFQQSGITSLVDMDYVLLITPEVSVGGIAGIEAKLRWLPTMTVGDMGDLNYLGFGVAYGVSNLMPTLPFDARVGFFYQNLGIGEMLQTSGTSFYAAASKSFAMLTVYAGAAKESSSMDVEYTFTSDTSQTSEISFSVDGIQGGRGTLGATLNFGLLVNAEVNFGKLTTYSAGILFGF